MKTAHIVVLAVALAAGGGAAFLAGRSDVPPPAALEPVASIDTVDVLVALADIKLGQTIAAANMGWAAWPTASASPLYVHKSDRPDAIQKLAGAMARVPIATGEPLRESKLIMANGSGYMAAVLPAGMRAVSTEISPETGAGGFILPNDRVDVILSRRDKETERLTGVESMIAETLLNDVRVLAIDQNVEEKTSARTAVGKTATLELTSRQVETLAMGRLSGTLSLALRSLADSDPAKRAGEPAAEGSTSSNRINMVRFGVRSTIITQ
jgi:pilus assembly protein CpaB